MSTTMPILETERLVIRPFALGDLSVTHPMFDAIWKTATPLVEHEAWLRWSALNHGELAKLGQPPYGDRAIVLKSSQRLIGAVGVVPSFGPFGVLPAFGAAVNQPAPAKWDPAMGLFWAIAPEHRGQGYAAEAARAVIDFLFNHFNLRRVVATTEYANLASQAVMRKLGMKVERNPLAEPAWFQVVGVLYNPAP